MTTTTETDEKERALARLVELREARKQLDLDEVAAVAAARNAGLTWRELAPAMGSTFQYVQKRFAPQLQVTVGPADDVPLEGKHARRRPRS